MLTFEQFICESDYMTYGDYVKLRDESVIPFLVDRDNMKNYAKEKLMSLLPLVGSLLSYQKLFIRLEDRSDPSKGIKFEAELFNGDVIHMIKMREEKSFKRWDFFLHRKRITEERLKSYLNEMLVREQEESTELVKYKRLMNDFDIYADMSDDRRKFNEFHSKKNVLIAQYKRLSKKEKYSAWELAKNKFHNYKEYKDFREFQGA